MNQDAAKEINMNRKKDGFKWYSPKETPFRILGFAWFHEENIYRRLPKETKGYVTDSVHHLADHTSGGQIRFQTDATTLKVYVKLAGKAERPHMPATAQCGIDCYVSKRDSLEDFHFVNVTKYEIDQKEYKCILYEDWHAEMRNVILNMPLYQGVEEILIAVNESAKILAPPQFISQEKIIIYGTSITQGACASRPGMSYSNILSRRIPLEFINLGFSGSGKGEPEVAEVIRRIKNPRALILDYEGNVDSTDHLKKTLPEFIKIYREKHPKVPIVIPSRVPYALEPLKKDLSKTRMERLQFEKSLVNKLRSEGDQNIYFFNGSKSLGGEDFFECTVDGIHPNDLGFMRMANTIEPVLKTLLL